MERKAEWEVGGFQFGSEKDVELAKTEQEKIGFMEKECVTTNRKPYWQFTTKP